MQRHAAGNIDAEHVQPAFVKIEQVAREDSAADRVVGAGGADAPSATDAP
jgi:hypothetical protein